MSKMMTNGRRGLGLVFAGLLLATSAVDAAAAETGSDEWEFNGEVYMWGAGIDATTAAGDDIEISLSDILENFNIGAMGILTARNGKWTIFADGIYLDLEGDDSSTTKILRRSINTSVDIELQSFITTAGAGYAVIENDSTRLDLLAGGRYLWLDVDLEFDIGRFTEKASDSGSVIDGIIGFRGRTKIADDWHIVYYADVGTGESDITWQVLGGLDYRFKSVDFTMGYRYLDWEFDSHSVLDDLSVHGPYAGVKFTF